MRKGLHSGDTQEPVYPLCLLEDLDWWYGLESSNALAVTHRWKEGRERFVDIGFSSVLREPEWTARNREVITHEWIHVFCKHPGKVFVMWRDGRGPDPFSRFLNDSIERQCSYLTSYVLIKRRLLFEMVDATNTEIAVVADVPEHLVPLRWYLWNKHHM